MTRDCELCKFNNPRGTATAIVIRDGKLLMMKRNQEPFIGTWDLPGGFMSAGETPEETIRREIKEELGTDAVLDFVGWFPGNHIWKGQEYAILDHAFLAELKGEITLNEENSEYAWRDIETIDPSQTALSSNQAILRYVKEKFGVDYPTFVRLIAQLDSTTRVREINLYRSMLNGYMTKKVVEGRLVGVGWIFPRRTLSRKQAVVEDMIVDESERGKGYGKEILLDLMGWAKENGVEVIELTTNPKRVAANELYKRVGFELHPTNHYLYKVS